MSGIFSLSVYENTLLVLNDLNEAKDVFPLKQIDTINHYPLFQAIIACKNEGLIDLPELQLSPYKDEQEHRIIELPYSPIITIKGLTYLREKNSDLQQIIEKLSPTKIEATVNEQAKQGNTIAQKIKNTSNVLSDMENITKKGSSLVNVGIKILDWFNKFGN